MASNQNYYKAMRYYGAPALYKQGLVIYVGLYWCSLSNDPYIPKDKPLSNKMLLHLFKNTPLKQPVIRNKNFTDSGYTISVGSV